MTALARTFVYSTALDLVSAELFVEKFQRSLRHSVHYVDGGWSTLVDGLRAAAERAGARIVSNAHVEGVELGDGHARGVRLRDGSLVRVSAVVVATGPRDAAKLVDGGEHPAMRRIVDGLAPARIACLDVGLERLPVPDRPVVQDLDGPRFMSAQSVYSRVAPEGAALIIAFKQLDPRYPGDPREDERDLEDLLEAAQPGWRAGQAPVPAAYRGRRRAPHRQGRRLCRATGPQGAGLGQPLPGRRLGRLGGLPDRRQHGQRPTGGAAVA
jgi:hypothetical protein